MASEPVPTVPSLRAGTAPPAADPVSIGAAIADRAHVSAVFGQAVRQGETTVIPVARATWGFGAGASVSPAAGSGGGGGMMLSPVGYISLTGKKVRFRRFSPSPAVLGAFVLAGSALFLLARQAIRLRQPRTPNFA